MIEINLLSEDLIAKSRSHKPYRTAFKFSARYFIYLIPGILGVLIALHLAIGIAIISKGMQLQILSARWKGLESKRAALGELKKANTALSQDAMLIQQLTNQRIDWAQKLNILSLALPPGIWFTEIAVTQKDFFLQGSVISLEKEELTLINRFLNNIKSNQAFLADFDNLELGGVQTKMVGGYEVADFTIGGRFKQK